MEWITVALLNGSLLWSECGLMWTADASNRHPPSLVSTGGNRGLPAFPPRVAEQSAGTDGGEDGG
jgi:hypothetical protein